MLKSITECSQRERMIRALLACEALTYMFEEGDVEDKKLSEEIYSVIHASLCHCANPHTEWLKKIESIEEWGKKTQTYDVEKILKDFYNDELKESIEDVESSLSKEGTYEDMFHSLSRSTNDLVKKVKLLI